MVIISRKTQIKSRGRYQLVTVAYESCEKIFKKLGFRNRPLTELSYPKIWQSFRNQSLTGFSYRFHEAFVKEFVRAFGFHAWQDFHIIFNNFLMNFTDLWYHSHHNIIRKLCQISSTKALPKKSMTGLSYFENNENSLFTSYYTPKSRSLQVLFRIWFLETLLKFFRGRMTEFHHEFTWYLFYIMEIFFE